MRSSPEHDAWLKARLEEAVQRFAGGSQDKLGRMLGYTNGGYIREILAGKKPVRAAIIERADDSDELRGWFTPAAPPEPAADAALPEHFKPLLRRLMRLSPEQQEEALAAAVQATVFVRAGVPVEVRPLERAAKRPNPAHRPDRETQPTSARATTHKSTVSRSR